MAKSMDDVEVKAILDANITNAMGFLGGDLSAQRRMAMEYYLGEPFGNEVEGRSQVVSTDVSDVIEWMLPSLVKMFAESDEAVRFEPVSEQDVAAAEQETDYVNHVFYQQNEGFLIFYSWFKDALLQKNGYVKSYWEESEKKTREAYQNLDDNQFQYLMLDKDLELVEHTEQEDPAALQMMQQMPVDPNNPPQIPKLHDAVFMRTQKRGKVKIVPVPPEEIGIIKTHNSVLLDDVAFMYHKREMTVTDLIELGYDPKIVNDIPSAQQLLTEEEVARNNLADERNLSESELDKSMRRVTVYECYIKIDYDKDGVAELRKITKAGNVILDNEPFDSIPFHSITPTLLTHKHFGLSVADAIMDLQLIKSTIWRQLLDNMYYINNSRTVVNESIVNIDDLLVSRPNGIVRVQGMPGEAVAPMPVTPIGQSVFPLIEYIDTVREGRTGVSDATTGLDPDLLNNNKGDASVARMMSAAQQRVELIARLFAETGVKSLFRHIHELLMKHQDKEAVVKLRNKWVNINPCDWFDRDMMTVHVGLGSDDRTKLINAMMGVMSVQEKVVAANGLDILVSKQNLYQTAIDFAKYSGLKNADQYFQDPNSPQAQQELQNRAQQAQMAQQNDPNNKLIEVQQAQVQLERQQLAATYENKIQDMQMKYQQHINELNSKLEQHATDTAIKLTELELKYQTNVPGALV